MTVTLVTLEVRSHEFGSKKAPARFANKQAMHAHNCKTVRETWSRKCPDVPPHVLAYSPVSNTAYFLYAIWRDRDEKNAAFMAFSQTLKEYECSHYTFICETRLRAGKLDGPLETTHEDAVSVVTSDIEGKALCSNFFQDETGKVQRLPEWHSKGGDANVQGLVGCFLRPEDLMENYASVCLYETEHEVGTT